MIKTISEKKNGEKEKSREKKIKDTEYERE